MAGGCEHCDHDEDDYCHPGQIVPTVQHYGPIKLEGELVRVYTKANPNYQLSGREDGVVLAFKNQRDRNQLWIRVDVGAGNGKFFDREGQPGFILVNKATGLPLKHGHHVHDFVTTHRQVFGANSLESSILWSLGKKDEGLGYRGLRPVTNITLNLNAENGDKAHGGVRDGNRLLLSPWKPVDHLKWKVEPVEPKGE